MLPALASRIAGLPLFLFRSHFIVRGASMSPALRDGDFVHILPRRWNARGFPRGALVVVSPPAESFPAASSPSASHPHHPGPILVKRVVALPGEYVRVNPEGTVDINDAPLAEPYPISRAAAGAPPHPAHWLCGADEYFIMGDNRADSGDSRRYGPVPYSRIIGRVWLRWPARRPPSPAPSPQPPG